MVHDELIGKGIAFPFAITARGGIATSAGPRRVQDAIWLILSTSPGERIMRPQFGAGVGDYVFDTNTPVTRTRLADAIRQALVRWEPRIDLIGVRVDEVPDQRTQVMATVEYRLRDTNELFNLVYPLYLAEGAR